MDMDRQNQLAVFLATSGHSGVDRIMKNLIGEMTRRKLPVDLLRIDNHGPFFDPPPDGLEMVSLGTAHVNSSLPGLIRYLKTRRPAALLTDKDRVNRIAILARSLAGTNTRLVIRVGTTVSVNMKHRGRFQRWLQTFSYRKLYPKADAIVLPSLGAAEDLARVGRLRPDRIHVLPSPVVGDEIFEKAARPVDHPWLSSVKEVPVILGVGELSRRKDFGTLLEAFAAVRKHRPCRLVILGRGNQKSRLQDMGRQLGIDQDMCLTGFVDNPYPYMCNADMLASASRWEGSPVVLMEALALGLPVVATDCPSGPREVLENGRLGPLVPVGDAAALAKAIESTLDSPVDADRLRSAAQAYQIAESTDRYLAVMGVTC
jgi:glycosyltransferase involved in cell wall biosynthesis